MSKGNVDRQQVRYPPMAFTGQLPLPQAPWPQVAPVQQTVASQAYSLDLTQDRGVMNHGGSVQMRDINFTSPASQPQPSLRDSLWFDEIKHREHTITDASEGTCSWFVETAQYAAWNANSHDKQNRFLWIKGNAGAGKSTIMKFAVEHARNTGPTGEIILSHFFNARGTALEQSTEGMYRTLLVYLLDRLPQAAAREFASRYGGDAHKFHQRHWPLAELERMLKYAVGKLGDRSAVFYIDALDECDDHEIRRMLRVFRDLVRSGKRIRVLFSSRPYPAITFSDAIFMDLSQQEEHNEDIRRYIDDSLEVDDSNLAQELKYKLLEKAGGIIMWVCLVVDRLNQEHDGGNVADLERQLDEIPPGLHQLFRYTLERYPQTREAMLLCFQWVLFNSYPFMQSSQYVWWGIQRGLNRGDLEIRQDYKLQTEASMQRYVVGVAKGLVEFDSDGHSQFIHQSVRDFLYKEEEMRKLYGAESQWAFETQSYEQLRNCFLREVEARRSQVLEMLDGNLQFLSPMAADRVLAEAGWLLRAEDCQVQYPLALWTVPNILRIAERLHCMGQDQTAFLADFEQRLGPGFFCNRTLRTNLISCLLDLNCPALIRDTQLERARHARLHGQAYGLIDAVPPVYISPLVNAVATDKYEPVKALLEVLLLLEPRPPRLQQLLLCLAASEKGHASHMGHVRTDRNPPLLSLARLSTSVAMFMLLVFAPTVAIEPHLGALDEILAGGAIPMRNVHLLRVVSYFIDHQLSSDAIDLTTLGTLRWASSFTFERNEESEAAENLVASLQQCGIGVQRVPSSPSS